MKKNKLAFALAIVAGLIALTNFGYKLIRYGAADYLILLAGIFLIILGITNYFAKPKNR